MTVLIHGGSHRTCLGAGGDRVGRQRARQGGAAVAESAGAAAGGPFSPRGRGRWSGRWRRGSSVDATFRAPELLPDWPIGGRGVSARVLAKMSYRAEPEGVLAIVEAPAARCRRTGRSTSSRSGSRSRATSGRWRARPRPQAPTRSSSPTRRPMPGTRTRSALDRRRLHPADRGGTLDEVAASALQKVAAVVDAPTRHTDADLTEPTALARRGGGRRPRRALARRGRHEVATPMRARSVDSLNAATAAAIILFEAVRQRG